ncbi:MAG: ArsR/SmtB family transcription factor [Spirochaetota bacterium]
MNETDQLRAQERAEVLKALAHPTRAYIVDLIAREGEHCVCELTERIGVDTSTVSRHLSLLKSAGILFDRKVGTTVYYNVTCTCISDFMKGLDTVLRSRHERRQVAFGATVAAQNPE